MKSKLVQLYKKNHYNDNISVKMIDLSNGKSNKAKFILK